MASYNKLMLMGNLTRDPQLSYLPSQVAVVDFGMATNRTWTTQDGSKREEVCFVDCRAFGKTAETINKYLSKGSPIFLEGRLTFDSWTAQDGSKRSKHRVTVEGFQFLPSGSRQGSQDGQRQQQASTATHQPNGGGCQSPIPDDDIPF